MSKSVKYIVSILLVILTVLTPLSVFPSAITASAVTYSDLNAENVFLKQQTSITCTLASAAMLMRRTAICSEYDDWENITEENIRQIAWIEGTGLRWNYTCYNITIGHGYFSAEVDNKEELLKLLELNPQGVVIYNGGMNGQSHAVLLCDYNKKYDTFYVADPAQNAPSGRIPLIESTIVGETQDEQIENLTAYWYVVSPSVSVEDDNFFANDEPPVGPDDPNVYDPTADVDVFNSTKKKIYSYYVVSDESAGGTALRNYPSGSSDLYKRLEKGTILYITYQGKNNFGATWYKTNTGHYIFSNNLTAFDEFSAETIKFRNTAETANATYTVNAKNDTRTPLRLEPSEGNNIVAYVNNGDRLYITHSGVNSVGSAWLKTQEGYYVKASEMEYKSSEKEEDSSFTGTYTIVNGSYSASPIEDPPEETPFEPVEYKITASALNVRKSAVDGEVIGVLGNGTVVVVTAILSGWGRISYNGSEGWISLDYAEKVTEEIIPVKIESIKISDDFVQTGNSVSCSVSVSADVTCMYKFSLYDDSGEKIYSQLHHMTKNTFSYNPDKPGVYYFFVEVLTSDEREISGYSGNFVVHNKLQIDSVKSDVDEYTYAYEKITWTVDTVSGSDSVFYMYSVYHNGELLFERSSFLNTLSYIPEKAGNYVLKVYLEDSYSSSEEISSEEVTVYNALGIDVVTVSELSVTTGGQVVCEIKASGGTGNPLYCFTVFKDNKVVKNGAYSQDSESVITFSEKGIYKIFCAVKDSANSIASAFSAEITVMDIMPGDVNGDGQITAADARLVLRYSARIGELTADGLIAADVTKDNAVNASDARLILRCSANLESI